jgi:hypothetical protein
MAVAVAVLSAGTAWAQEEADPHRTAVSLVGGLSVGSSPVFGGRLGYHGSDAGFVAGGGIAHDLSPRLTLEANGLWLDRGSSAWSADAGLRFNLAPSANALVPYFAASGGVYSEHVDDPVDRALDAFERLPVVGAFGRRARDFVESVGYDTDSTHTNGMVTFGGGVRFASGEHVFVRPDARAQVVFGNDTRVLGLFTLSFGYRF